MDVDRRERLRCLVERWASAEGHSLSPLAGLLFNRCSKGQNCDKGIVNGVTLWLVMQGHAQVHVHDLTFEVAPFKQLVITGETALHSTTSMPADGRPFLSLNLTFSPETIVKGLMALAGVVAEAMKLIGMHAPKNWPEFSDMECYQCHHDLRNDVPLPPPPDRAMTSWRIARGYD